MPEVASISHAIGAVAFFCIAILLSIHKTTLQRAPWVIAACIFTGIWSAIASLYGYKLIENYQWVVFSEVFQDVSWCFALIHMITSSDQKQDANFSKRRKLSLVLASATVALLGNALLIQHQWLPGKTSLFIEIDFVGHLCLSILGLSLIEQLYRGVKPQSRWGIKFFCLGVGALFCYDFYMYAHALLFQQLNEDLWYARGGISLFVAPLIALSAFRNPRWNLDISPSRVLIYRSTVIVTCGIYLLAMAAIGFGISAFGGHWGEALSIVFLFGAALLLFSLLFSGKARAYLKTMLAKHVFRLYYDYREEWLRFSALLGRADSDYSLTTRVIMAFAAMVESPEGLLFERRQNGFYLQDSWNLNLELPNITHPKAITFFLEQERPVLVSELSEHGEIGKNIQECLASFIRAWLIVPLKLNDKVEGFVILGRPRVRVDINWEVSDLLVTASRQAAVFLQQQQLSQALMVAKQFESYHQISAFMLHDIKNLLSSTQLILQNKKHASDPRFVDTIFITLESIHNKLFKLQNQLHQPGNAWSAETVDLAPLLEQVVAECRLKGKNVELMSTTQLFANVQLDRESFKHCMMHLIDNGLEASQSNASVQVELEFKNKRILVKVTDKGSGMTQQFINNELFRPFVSTKGQKGMGIGVFQVKSFVERAKGTLMVHSEVGIGSTFIMDFPRFEAATSLPQQEKVEELA